MSKKNFYVYILKCSDGTYYIGTTQDPVRRILEHNGELKGGAKYTRARRPVVIVYKECQNSKSEALKREILLKKLSHSQKELLISSSNFQ